MKTQIKSLLLVVGLVCASLLLSAQPPPTDPGPGEGPVGNGSIGGGLIVLLTMAGAYGAKKVYDARKKLSD